MVVTDGDRPPDNCCVGVDVTGGDRPPDDCCVGVDVTSKDPLSEGRDAVGVTGRDRVLVLLFAVWLVFCRACVLEQRS